MLFVINTRGDTKIIQKRHWGKFVRRLNDGSENTSTKENVIEEEEECHELTASRSTNTK